MSPITENLPTTVNAYAFDNSSITVGNQKGVAIVDTANKLGDTTIFF